MNSKDLILKDALAVAIESQIKIKRLKWMIALLSFICGFLSCLVIVLSYIMWG